MTSSRQKWLAKISEKLESQPFFSQKFEECAVNFTLGPWFNGETLQEAFGIETHDLEEIYSEAYAFYEQDQCMESEDLFRLLVMLNPFIDKYWLGLGASLQVLERYEEALKSYGVMSWLDEKSPYPLYYASQCLEPLNRNEEAKQALCLAQKLASEDPLKFRDLYL